MPKTKYIIIAALLLVAAVSAAAGRAWRGPSAARTSLDQLTGKAAFQSGARSGEVIPLTLRARGFDPEDITRPAGSYLIAVNNRSGLTEFSLQLDRKNEGRVREIRLKEDAAAGARCITLRPGSMS